MKRPSEIDKARARAKATSVPNRNVLGHIPAGEIAEAITMIETGRTEQAVLRLRLLLRKHAHPEPVKSFST